MPWCVDQVYMVEFPVFCLVGKAHGLAFDGNSPFALNIHAVKDLVLEFTVGYNIRGLYKTVGQC